MFAVKSTEQDSYRGCREEPRTLNNMQQCYLFSFAVASHAANDLGVSQHRHHYTESINQSAHPLLIISEN